jgi:hypothetical protein
MRIFTQISTQTHIVEVPFASELRGPIYKSVPLVSEVKMLAGELLIHPGLQSLSAEALI